VAAPARGALGLVKAVRGINRAVDGVMPKPPGTIEGRIAGYGTKKPVAS